MNVEVPKRRQSTHLLAERLHGPLQVLYLRLERLHSAWRVPEGFLAGPEGRDPRSSLHHLLVKPVFGQTLLLAHLVAGHAHSGHAVQAGGRGVDVSLDRLHRLLLQQDHAGAGHHLTVPRRQGVLLRQLVVQAAVPSLCVAVPLLQALQGALGLHQARLGLPRLALGGLQVVLRLPVLLLEPLKGLLELKNAGIYIDRQIDI